MNRPSTAREALIVEAIGDVAQLIDRAEALTRAMEQSRQTLVQAGAQLGSQLAGFESRMAAITDNAKIQAVQHIARRTNELTLRLRDEQTRAMAEAARSFFAKELGPTLQRLAVPLQHLVDRLERPWEHWLTHAATAAVASAATWVLAAYG